nr:uncharacterized protein LOC112030211 [Quercus suber]
MANFWPISLCNVVYKLISKTIANRFKALLPHIISENQSALTSDRLITDNVLVAFELMHFLNHKNVGKEGYMVAKLDMSKAFDRVKRCFIQAVMEKLGFSSKWVWHMAKNAVDDYVCSASWDFEPTRSAPSNWVLPPPGIHKVNVDGASSEHDSFSNVGVVIRDRKGQVVSALCLPL